jgi:hypothetical protein
MVEKVAPLSGSHPGRFNWAFLFRLGDQGCEDSANGRFDFPNLVFRPRWIGPQSVCEGRQVRKRRSFGRQCAQAIANRSVDSSGGRHVPSSSFKMKKPASAGRGLGAIGGQRDPLSRF